MMSWLSYSTVYAWFAGWAEAAAGFLLLSRRFTTLGAALCVADMGMVWLINQSYWDNWGGAAITPLYFLVPALFLLVPYRRRFVEFFLGRKAAPIARDEIVQSSRMHRVGVAAKVFAVSWVFYVNMAPNLDATYYRSIKSPLYGIYRVERFERNRVEEPLDPAHPTRWHEVAFDSRGSGLTMLLANGEEDRLGISWPVRRLEMHNLAPWKAAEPQREVVSFTLPAEADMPTMHYLKNKPIRYDTLRYSRAANGDLTLRGRFDGDSVSIILRKIPINTLPYFQNRWHPI
jgi:hypothetical protein